MPTSGPLRALLLYALAATPVAALIFLAVAQFFAAWDGYAVSVWPPEGEDPRTFRVLVMEDDGTRILRWDAHLIEGLDLPYDATGVPPMKVPEEAPHTSKSRFSLHFLVEGKEGGHQIVPTTSPFAVTLAVLAWVVGLAVRNMAMGGSPFELTPRPTVLPAPLPKAGTPAPAPAVRPKKGPPPPRGKRRRR